ncbi:MAG: molybdate ABC transporter substrate-binding protein [Nitrospiria bacterium]
MLWNKFVQFILFVVLLFLTPCEALAGELIVSAAASLSDALGEIGKTFKSKHPMDRLFFNWGASGILMRQIEQGAPADVFISASPNEMNELESKNLLVNSTRRDLLKNEVVLIIPAGSGRSFKSFRDLNDPSIQRIAIGDPEFVPCGRYTRQIMVNLGLWESLKPRLIFGADVRQVLEYVSRDEVDAGVVFATDAEVKLGKVKVAAMAPENTHEPVVYPAAVIKGTKNAELAGEWMDFMAGPEGTALFKKYHFKPIKKGIR